MSIFLKLFFQDIELIYRNRKKLFKGNFSFSYLGLVDFLVIEVLYSGNE